ncbi:MAG: hypothetical protein M4579_000320 [Chaenotheca gracillima]|nr:MAG: hypothetical protein M4579_000320 [Chaenotheca gracillima]
MAPPHPNPLHHNSKSSAIRRKRGVAFDDSPTSLSNRWNRDLEVRLQHIELELERHQKQWSAKQEDYLGEVEALRDMKKAFDKFLRRRTKDQQSEGEKFKQALSLAGSSDDENQQEVPKGFGGLLRRASSSKTLENDTVPQRSRSGTKLFRRASTAPSGEESEGNSHVFGGLLRKVGSRRKSEIS